MRLVQAYQRVVQGWLLATPRGVVARRVPLGFRVQARLPLLRDLAARIFGLGVWPVRLRPAPTLPPIPAARSPPPAPG